MRYDHGVCWRGHDLLGDNVRIQSNGHRLCVPCHKDRMREYMRKKRNPGYAIQPRGDSLVCKWGHALTPDNTLWHNNHRVCARCKRSSDSDSRRRRKGERVIPWWVLDEVNDPAVLDLLRQVLVDDVKLPSPLVEALPAVTELP